VCVPGELPPVFAGVFIVILFETEKYAFDAWFDDQTTVIGDGARRNARAAFYPCALTCVFNLRCHQGKFTSNYMYYQLASRVCTRKTHLAQCGRTKKNTTRTDTLANAGER
jgi:hypothetical protein